MSDYALSSTVYMMFTSSIGGVPSALSSGVVSAYEDGGLTQITAGITLTPDFDGVIGMNLIAIAATGANGYESGKEYDLVVTTGTIGGQSVAGTVVGHFEIEKGSALRPTTAARTLDVSAGGEAGIDWANVGTPGSTVNLSATTTNLVNTLTTYTGNTVQTGDSFARIGAAGAGLTGVTGATLSSAYDFAKGTVAMTESYAANAATATPVQALYAIHQMLMQFAISSTTYTVKKLDNSTTAFVVTLDSATTPTSAVRT